MNTLFFTVVIPTLNEEKYLNTILQALSKQTFRDFELIVVDGGSVDKTEKIFQKYQSLMSKAFYFKTKTSNVAYQRNFGAGQAKGEYLVFFDADVDIESTFLEEIHIAAIKKKFEFATTWISPDSSKSVDILMIQLANLGAELAKSINKPISGGYNTIVRKDIFKKLKGFRENLPISEDHDFAIRASKKNIDILILKEPRVVFSLRRFRSQGTLSVLRKYALATTHMLLKGPITKELFEYPMGGHVHEIRKKDLNMTKINHYFSRIRQFQNRLVNLLLD